MSHPPKQPPQPRATDPAPGAPYDPDAWLDDVRRWYYGGTEPADPAPAMPPPASLQSMSASASICRSTGNGS